MKGDSLNVLKTLKSHSDDKSYFVLMINDSKSVRVLVVYFLHF